MTTCLRLDVDGDYWTRASPSRKDVPEDVKGVDRQGKARKPVALDTDGFKVDRVDAAETESFRVKPAYKSFRRAEPIVAMSSDQDVDVSVFG